MRLVSLASTEGVMVELSAEECELIAQGCKDDSTVNDLSLSGELSLAFQAMAFLIPRCKHSA